MSDTGRQSGTRCEISALKRGKWPRTDSVLFMEKEPEYLFTAAQYAELSDEEKKAIHKVAEYLIDGELEAFDDKSLSKTFNILRPCDDGCVPHEEIGADFSLEDAIHRKFACVYSN